MGGRQFQHPVCQGCLEVVVAGTSGSSVSQAVRGQGSTFPPNGDGLVLQNTRSWWHCLPWSCVLPQGKEKSLSCIPGALQPLAGKYLLAAPGSAQLHTRVTAAPSASNSSGDKHRGGINMFSP